MATLLAFLLAQDAESRKVDTDAHCLECHADQAEEIKGSVHEREGCVKCHGADEIRTGRPRGNPHRKLDTFKSWKGRNLTEDCGSCHMGIVLALRRSEHFVDTRTATGSMKRGCIDCHDYHAVKEPN